MQPCLRGEKHQRILCAQKHLKHTQYATIIRATTTNRRIQGALAARTHIRAQWSPLQLLPVSISSKERTRRSQCTDFIRQILEFHLLFGKFLGSLFIFGLPLISGLLESLHFAFVVTALNIGLTEPVRERGSVSIGLGNPRATLGRGDCLVRRKGKLHSLLVQFADGPVRFLSLFLKHLDLALHRLGLRASGGASAGLLLEGLD